jgi:hypothetical protein
MKVEDLKDKKTRRRTEEQERNSISLIAEAQKA